MDNIHDLTDSQDARDEIIKQLRAEIEQLRRDLSDVPLRFADLADLLETKGHLEHVGFMRASAERYRKVLRQPHEVSSKA